MTWTGHGTRLVGMAAYESHLPGRLHIGLGSEFLDLDLDQAETLVEYLTEAVAKLRAAQE